MTSSSLRSVQRNANVSSAIRRALVVAAIGMAAVIVAPFVFFPEIMGDVGVTHASALRNTAALVVIVLGVIAALGGLAALAWQLVKRPRKNAERGP